MGKSDPRIQKRKIKKPSKEEEDLLHDTLAAHDAYDESREARGVARKRVKYHGQHHSDFREGAIKMLTEADQQLMMEMGDKTGSLRAKEYAEFKRLPTIHQQIVRTFLNAFGELTIIAPDDVKEAMEYLLQVFPLTSLMHGSVLYPIHDIIISALTTLQESDFSALQMDKYKSQYGEYLRHKEENPGRRPAMSAEKWFNERYPVLTDRVKSGPYERLTHVERDVVKKNDEDMSAMVYALLVGGEENAAFEMFTRMRAIHKPLHWSEDEELAEGKRPIFPGGFISNHKAAFQDVIESTRRAFM